MVELVYKFDEKSTTSDRKGELTAKVLFKLFWGHISILCIHIQCTVEPQITDSTVTENSVNRTPRSKHIW